MRDPAPRSDHNRLFPPAPRCPAWTSPATPKRQIRKGAQTRTFDGANRITVIGGKTYATLVRI